MTGHIFILNSQLYFTGEEIPEKPKHIEDPENVIGNLNELAQFIKYNPIVASIRERATLVGNADEAFKIALPGGDGKFKPEYFICVMFYEVDCEVRYEKQPCPCRDAGMDARGCEIDCNGGTNVAFLSPHLSGSEKEETQDELWGEILKQSTIQFYNKNIIVDLKSRFKITRIK